MIGKDFMTNKKREEGEGRKTKRKRRERERREQEARVRERKENISVIFQYVNYSLFELYPPAKEM